MSSVILPVINKPTSSSNFNFRRINNLKQTASELESNSVGQGKLLLDALKTKLVKYRIIDKSRWSSMVKHSQKGEPNRRINYNTHINRSVHSDFTAGTQSNTLINKASCEFQKDKDICKKLGRKLRVMRNVSFTLNGKQKLQPSYGETLIKQQQKFENKKIDEKTINYFIDKSINKSTQEMQNKFRNTNINLFAYSLSNRNLLQNQARIKNRNCKSLNFNSVDEMVIEFNDSKKGNIQLLLNLTYIPLNIEGVLIQNELAWKKLEYISNPENASSKIAVDLSVICRFPLKYCLLSNFFFGQGQPHYADSLLRVEINKKFYLSEISKWKKSYINLMQRWHPDKLMSKNSIFIEHFGLLDQLLGLSGEIIEEANDCYRRINEAFHVILNSK